ncbi:MAG: segregation/condensation protein A [Patescibacteria group bacterium]|nr:segregation/condensation protein A [Patescibacteria group bacterium]
MIDFQVEKFQGPLGLLLQLIESEEMDITEIALAAIADQYVAYVERAENIDPEEIADFLVIAARLLYIKSKALLPYLSTEEEEAEIGDLERQLKMYKEFIEASLKVSALIDSDRRLFAPVFTKGGRRGFAAAAPSFIPPKQLLASDLESIWRQALARLRKQEKKLPEARLEPKVSIDERISHIRGLLAEQLSLSFQRLLEKAETKVEVIVNILAVLELAKQRELVFEQEELFSEIRVLKI